jgi:hypothetical protein
MTTIRRRDSRSIQLGSCNTADTCSPHSLSERFLCFTWLAVQSPYSIERFTHWLGVTRWASRKLLLKWLRFE